MYARMEGESILPGIQKVHRDAVSLKQKYQEAEQASQSYLQRVAMQGGVMVDRDAILQSRAERDQLGERLKAAVEKIHEYGCHIKDLDIGLIDFPPLFRGREVYLCWKMGEPGIRFWHGVDEGFAGRKPIDQEFLDHHQGDL